MNEVAIALGSAIITGFFGVIKSQINTNKSIKILQAKIDEHNHYGEKFSDCVTNIQLLQKDVDYITREIKEIKEKIK